MARTSLPDLSKLKSKEVKQLLSKLELWYDIDSSFLKEYSFYNTPKGKLYIANVSLEELDLKGITGIGMYFGTFADNDRFRLSIEGSRLIKAKKNFIELNDKSIKSYISGENLFKEEVKITYSNDSPFVIVKYEEENIGVASISDDLIHTFVPKGRRLNFNRLF